MPINPITTATLPLPLLAAASEPSPLVRWLLEVDVPECAPEPEETEAE